MALELHVWGQGFGLPSTDPECLATVTYLTYAAPRTSWRIIASSPSAVPPHVLPALFDPSTQRWIAGFGPITALVRAVSPAAGLDAGLTAAQQADSAAYASLLAVHAAPLLALYLYVSSANWAAATRPALSHSLPFPLAWTEPPAVRAAEARRAEHLGLSSLDTDADPDAAAEDRAGFLQVPQSLRRTPRTVSAALTPEQAARIRLDGLADGVFSVLEGLKGRKTFLLRDDEHDDGKRDGLAGRRADGARPTSLDCLTFGYLALMLVPDVPRPFLREAMMGRYPGLCAFVTDVRGCFEGVELPWVTDAAVNSVVSVSGRFLQGALTGIPHVGAEWQRWQTWRRRSPAERQDTASDVLAAVCGAAAIVTLVAGVVLYRRLPPFGSPLLRYSRQVGGYRSLGAVGAAIGLGPTWAESFGGGRISGSRGEIDGVELMDRPTNESWGTGGVVVEQEIDVEL